MITSSRWTRGIVPLALSIGLVIVPQAGAHGGRGGGHGGGHGGGGAVRRPLLLRQPAYHASPYASRSGGTATHVAIIAVPHTLTGRPVARMPKQIRRTLNPTPIVRKPLLVAPTPAITPRPLPAAPTPAITPRPLPAAPTPGITSRPQVEPAIQPSELAVQPRSGPCRRSPGPVASCRMPTHMATGRGARSYRAYGYGNGYRNRSYGRGYGYGRSQGLNRGVIAGLMSVRASLARVAHDYQGHRVRAMHAITMAIRQLSHRSMSYNGMGFSSGYE